MHMLRNQQQQHYDQSPAHLNMGLEKAFDWVIVNWIYENESKPGSLKYITNRAFTKKKKGVRIMLGLGYPESKACLCK